MARPNINQNKCRANLAMLIRVYLIFLAHDFFACRAQVLLQEKTSSHLVSVSSMGKYILVLNVKRQKASFSLYYNYLNQGFDYFKIIQQESVWFDSQQLVSLNIYKSIYLKNFKPQFSHDESYLYFIKPSIGPVKASLNGAFLKVVQNYTQDCPNQKSCLMFVLRTNNTLNQLILYKKEEYKFIIYSYGKHFSVINGNDSFSNLLDIELNDSLLTALYFQSNTFYKLHYDLVSKQQIYGGESNFYCKAAVCFNTLQVDDYIEYNGFVRSKNVKLNFTLTNLIKPTTHEWVSQSFSKALQSFNRNLFGFSFFKDGLYYIELVTNMVTNQTGLSLLPNKNLLVDLQIVEKDFIFDFDFTSDGRILAYASSNNFFVIKQQLLTQEVIKCHTDVLYFQYCNNMDAVSWVSLSLSIFLMMFCLTLFFYWLSRRCKKQSRNINSQDQPGQHIEPANYYNRSDLTLVENEQRQHRDKRVLMNEVQTTCKNQT